MATIKDVAKEAGYRNVIDSSMGVMLYSNPDDDLMPLVKKKLNLTTPAPATGTTTPGATKPAGK